MSGATADEVRRIGTDPDVFEAFYRQHVDAVQRFVVRRIGDRDRAADLTTEVFLAAVGAADDYRPGRGAPGAWLYGIARNVLAAEHRRQGRELRAMRRLAGRRPLDADDVARWDERIDAEARARTLYRAMGRLTVRERAVVELVSLDGLTVQDAARVLGVRPVTARMRLSRARRRLREDANPSAADPAVVGHYPSEASS
jgi:RNA polymerase sigma factor (sigma-70 family)